MAHSGGIQAVIGSQAGAYAALRIVLLQAVSLFSLAMHIRAFHSGIMAFSGGALRAPFLLSLDSESAISVPMDKHLLGVALGMGGWGVILLGASFIIGFESLGWLDGAALAGNSTATIHPLPYAFLCSKRGLLGSAVHFGLHHDGYHLFKPLNREAPKLQLYSMSSFHVLEQVQLFSEVSAAEATAIHALMRHQANGRLPAVGGHVSCDVLLPEEPLAVRAACVRKAIIARDSVISLLNTSNIPKRLFFTFRFVNLKLFKFDFFFVIAATHLNFTFFSSPGFCSISASAGAAA